MVTALIALALVAYGAALALLWRDRSVRPLLLLLSGSIATLAQPLWARLFGTPPALPGALLHLGSLSLSVGTIIGGGVLLGLPALVVFYGLRLRWWGRHYAACWGYFLFFVLVFLIVDAVGLRSQLAVFARPTLPTARLPEVLLHVALLAGTSFGMLYSFVVTRHYALRIALVPLLLSGLAAALLFNGILASPYWVVRFLQSRSTLSAVDRDRLVLGAVVITLALVLWGVHLLASALHANRRQGLKWR